MNTALRFILLLLHLAVVAIIVYYLGDIMSRDASGVGIVPNIIVLIALIITVIQHTKQFIIHFKNTIKP